MFSILEPHRRVISHRQSSTTIRPRSGVVAGQNSCNDSWPTPANSAAPSIRLRCTTSGRSKTSTPKSGRNHRNGSCGWPRVAARPSSSAAPATKVSTTAEALHGRHDEHWRAGCHGNGHVRFGKGSSEKELQPGATSPATYFTSRTVLRGREGEAPSRYSPGWRETFVVE